jgi:hypothetical protein
MIPPIHRSPELVEGMDGTRLKAGESADGEDNGVETSMAQKAPTTKGEGTNKGDVLAARCAAIPGKMAALGVAWAHEEFNAILSAKQHKAILPGVAKRGNVMANLWFVRAAHEFAAAALAANSAPDNEHLKFATETLLPACKIIVQEFISDKGMNGIRMDDSGMLQRADESAPVVASPLRLNALWYSALEITGQALRGISAMGKGHIAGAAVAAGRHTGDHYERLAGRFRRAFAKAFWCDEHGRICVPELRGTLNHGTRPDGEQLLLTMLPASPLPRTKQREILAHFESLAGDGVGIKVELSELGLVDSPLYRAWLVQGFAQDGDTRKTSALARPLSALADAAKISAVFAFYRERSPIGRQPDPFVSAEVLGVLHRFGVG